MQDSAKVFWHLTRLYWRQTFAATRSMFASNELVVNLSYVLATAPVIENHGYFELDVTPKPPKKAWRWIIAVRYGAWDDKCCWRESNVTPEQREALNGLYIEDLVACDAKLLKVTSRLVGTAAVCGWPQAPYLADRPVHVHESPLSWLLARGAGVFLCGNESEQQDWLRQCAPGLTTNTVALGESIMRKMRRPIPPLPPVRVYA